MISLSGMLAAGLVHVNDYLGLSEPSVLIFGRK